MSTRKEKGGAPESQTRKTLFTGEDDVEGHATRKEKDGSPEGATRKQLLIDDDNDVEGHHKRLTL